MKKTLATAMLVAGCISMSFAQAPDLSPSAPKEKLCDQFLGVQVNGLIRQVFNFNNSTAATEVNPYLLTYNINSRKTGWGLRASIGYNYNSSGTNDGITTRTSKLNDLHFRLGVEKSFKLSEKWSAGAGIDLIYNYNDDNTSASTISFDTVTTNTKTTISSYGGGAMGWLRYNLTKNITIGTESSFYVTTGNQKITVETIVAHNPNNTPPTDSDNKVSFGTISLPVVFYLSVKF